MQINLEVDDRSTLTTLEIFDKEIFDKYKFATITFETDIYTGNHYNTKEISRTTFEKHGYKLVYPDVEISYRGTYIGCFEDWWVHPDLIDTDKFKKIIDYTSPDGHYVSHAIRS